MNSGRFHYNKNQTCVTNESMYSVAIQRTQSSLRHANPNADPKTKRESNKSERVNDAALVLPSMTRSGMLTFHERYEKRAHQ